jgi:transposase
MSNDSANKRQWARIRNHFPEEHIPDGRPGRKPIPTRCVFEAVLWILNTGALWHMLPQSYPNYKSVHRRFQTWCRDEVLRRVLMDVANELRDKGAVDEAECFIDATFVMAKGGGAGIGSTKRGKGMKIMAISSWIAALGQHACRQSPRSSAGTAVLRLLHDRGQAGKFDRRSRLRRLPRLRTARLPR